MPLQFLWQSCEGVHSGFEHGKQIAPQFVLVAAWSLIQRNIFGGRFPTMDAVLNGGGVSIVSVVSVVT